VTYRNCSTDVLILCLNVGKEMKLYMLFLCSSACV